jgi:hypothetical protein
VNEHRGIAIEAYRWWINLLRERNDSPRTERPVRSAFTGRRRFGSNRTTANVGCRALGQGGRRTRGRTSRLSQPHWSDTPSYVSCGLGGDGGRGHMEGQHQGFSIP